MSVTLHERSEHTMVQRKARNGGRLGTCKNLETYREIRVVYWGKSWELATRDV